MYFLGVLAAVLCAAAGPVYAQRTPPTTGFQDQSGPLPSFRTSAQQVYFAYATGAIAAGRRRRITPAAFVYRGPFGGYAEYVQSTQRVALGALAAEVANRGWEATASYVLTGEATSERGVRPREPFDPAAQDWGALQVVARYAALTVDDEAFATELAAPGASRRAEQLTVGVNWYPTAWIKWYGTFERTTFDGSTASVRPPEDVVLFRFQVAF